MASSNIARYPRIGSSLPENVAWLPTAAKRRVQQRYNQHLRDYRKANPWPGEYRLPYQREQERDRERLTELGVHRTAEMSIALAILSALPDDVKRKAIMTVMALGAVDQGDGAQGAALLLKDYRP